MNSSEKGQKKSDIGLWSQNSHDLWAEHTVCMECHTETTGGYADRTLQLTLSITDFSQGRQKGCGSSPRNTTHSSHKPRARKNKQQESPPLYSLRVHPYWSGIFPSWSALWLRVLAWVCIGLPEPPQSLRCLKQNKEEIGSHIPHWHTATWASRS